MGSNCVQKSWPWKNGVIIEKKNPEKCLYFWSFFLNKIIVNAENAFKDHNGKMRLFFQLWLKLFHYSNLTNFDESDLFRQNFRSCRWILDPIAFFLQFLLSKIHETKTLQL